MDSKLTRVEEIAEFAKRMGYKKLGIATCAGLLKEASLFMKYSDALTTTLIAKDRVLGHNPVATVYLSDSYYSKIMKD